jgi:hypothetical protein
VANLGAQGWIRQEVNGFVDCFIMRINTIGMTIHMPDCISLYAFGKSVADSGNWADLTYSALHDGERLEYWLSNVNPTG